MANLITFKNAGKVYKILQSYKSNESPRHVCDGAKLTLATIDEDKFNYLKKMLKNYRIRKIFFAQTTDENDCCLWYQGQNALKNIKKICNVDVKNELVLCQNVTGTSTTTELFTSTPATTDDETEIGPLLTAVLVFVGVVVLAVFILLLIICRRHRKRRAKNARRSHQVCLNV